MPRSGWIFGLAAFGLVLFVPSSFGEEVSASQSQGTSLTIYNQNFALVRDQRNIKLNEGINYLRFEDVAAQIDPTSVSFQSLTAPNSVVVREQNYQYDLMSPSSILAKSRGKELHFKQYLSSGGVAEISGKLLNSPDQAQGLVLQTTDGIVLNPQGQVRLAELPSGLVPRPSLLWKLESTKAGDHKTEIAYQTAGLSWHCDYVAVVNKDDTLSDLTSWVTLDNKSGASYQNAALKLMAGDVHRVTAPAPRGMRGGAMYKAMESDSMAPQFTEAAFAEYHLYSLQGKTNVKDNETKQMSLFNAAAIPVKKLFVFEPSGQGEYYYGRPAGNNKVQVKFEIVNSDKNQLGMPMPKGKVRVYKKDADGALQFVGEDEIDHTPRDEKIRLYIGNAFDVVAEKKQLTNQSLGNSGKYRINRASYEISLRNHKKEDVTIVCIEHAYGDWTIINSSQPDTKKDSHTFEFQVKVPAGGETKVTYEVETKS